MVSAAEEFKLKLPKAHFKPLRPGQTLTESRLDKILRAANLDYQNYILYVEAYQVCLFLIITAINHNNHRKLLFNLFN